MNHDSRRARLYVSRACLLKCPECGTRPIFLPLLRIRSLRDYFTPLDGCPRCGYAYERETGYFLLAVWAINYGFGSILGIAIYCFLEFNYHLSLPVLLGVSLRLLCSLIFSSHATRRHCSSPSTITSTPTRKMAQVEAAAGVEKQTRPQVRFPLLRLMPPGPWSRLSISDFR